MGLFETIRSIDFEVESYPHYEDFIFLPLLALFFPTIRFFLDRFIFEAVLMEWVFCLSGVGELASVFFGLGTCLNEDSSHLMMQKVAGRLILGKWTAMPDVDKEGRRKINKFKESAWKFVYFCSAEILVVSLTFSEPWFTNTKYFWVGPGEQVWPDQKIKLKLKAVYMYAAGFYTYSIFALIFWETRRSDFGVSMGHHVATAILIVLSYIFRFARVGSVVLALHDASDVFLELGKMSKYSKHEMFASISFICFVASWIVLRLTYFPFWILRSTSYEVLLTLDKEKHKVEGPIYYYLFNTLLCCLLVLHIYWWVLIYRMLVKQIKARGQLGDDVRSDSDGEHED